MSIFWNIFLALIIANIFAYVMVNTNKKHMEMYKEEYSKWWTQKKYIVIYLITTIFTFLLFFGWIYTTF